MSKKYFAVRVRSSFFSRDPLFSDQAYKMATFLGEPISFHISSFEITWVDMARPFDPKCRIYFTDRDYCNALNFYLRYSIQKVVESWRVDLFGVSLYASFYYLNHFSTREHSFQITHQYFTEPSSEFEANHRRRIRRRERVKRSKKKRSKSAPAQLQPVRLERAAERLGTLPVQFRPIEEPGNPPPVPLLYAYTED